MKGMDLFHQGGWELVKVMPTPSSVVIGQEIHVLSQFFFSSLSIISSKFKNGYIKCRKLIGARFFNIGYGELADTFNSSRDNVGHGTHTLSIAGGNFVPGANVLGLGNGTVKGGSPRARVASYKVCWPDEANECMDPNTLAAFEAAIDDGVDVISISVGGEPKEFFSDALSVGAFHAVERGIVVVSSAGNVGPTPGTVSNVSPWILTVGASTTDRGFTNFVILGNKKKFKVTHIQCIQKSKNSI